MPTIYDAQWSGTVAFHRPGPRWVKVTKAYSDLAAAALVNDIEVLSLPVGWAFHAGYLKHSTPFTGGTIATYTLSLGITGNLTRYVAASDVLSAASGTLFGAPLTTAPVIENFGAATSVRLSAISTVGNLSAATAGSVDVYMLVGPVS